MQRNTQSFSQPATLFDVLVEIRQAKRWMLACAVLALAVGFLFLGAATPFYKARMIVGPANPISNNQGANDAAGMHATQDNGANVLNFARFESTLAGSAVAGILLKDEKIFEGLSQDRPLGLFASQDEWTPAELADYVRRRVRIEPIGETPLRRLVYYHPAPEFAAYFLKRLQEIDDAIIRDSIRNEAAARVQYLQSASVAIANPDHRRGLTNLLMEQERLLMLTSVEQPYAASVFEPAASSSRPEWPKRVPTLAAFMLCGAIFGFVLYGLRRA